MRYVIIGAGSAGCALAYRLGTQSENNIVVLEYGGSDQSPLIRMPAALSYPMNMPRYDWGYRAQPEEALLNRALACPRGKVLGGSSSINGMIFVRGHRLDYQFWEQSGAQGWGYEDVLPYFKRMEHHSQLTGPWRGQSGPMRISRGPRDNPLHEAFVAAAQQAGHPYTPDYNGAQQEGVGPADRTIYDGTRWSAARAYLRPALRRKNVQLINSALVDKILFQGRNACAVSYLHGGQRKILTADRVVLAAGAINSPQILQRSGVGPGELLQSHNIPVIHHNPAVGANLQDHLEVYLQYQCLQPVSLYRYQNPLSKALIGARWLLHKSGPGATNHFETLAFLRSSRRAEYPDIQFHFLPIAINYDGSAPASGHGFQVHLGPMRSKTRGHVKITADDPLSPPDIVFNYLNHSDDLPEFRQAIRLARNIIAQDAFQPFRGAELNPGDDATSDEALDAFVQGHAESAYHPCGTCRMGAEDSPDSVVNPRCQVLGVYNLFLADSSIFPRITNGNLNAPSLMVAEKGADHILRTIHPAIPALMPPPGTTANKASKKAPKKTPQKATRPRTPKSSATPRRRKTAQKAKPQKKTPQNRRLI